MASSEGLSELTPPPLPASPPKDGDVSRPISEAGPTGADEQRNEELKKVWFYLFISLFK
uniref:Uncharacterized protein n=1 Tax=Rhizophora mucronata TaxID=61149 RepID=A0A2P2K1J4_RHIMU